MTETAVRVLAERAVAGGGVPRYELTEWREEYGVAAGVTARDHAFDLSLHSETPIGTAMGRWQALRHAVGAGFEAMVVSRQVHGCELGVYQGQASGFLIRDGLDGHVSDAAGLLLAVTVADCIPVYLLAPGGSLGLLHAGWRGVAGGILERGVQTLCEVAGASPAELVMHCGIGICGACYEVGPEVSEAVLGHAPAEATALDLRDVLTNRAQVLGVGQITTSPWCSAHDNDRFYSHRRSGGADGRMAAYLGRVPT
ncbi:MAG: polyphenol oxidase family protein [Gemmatimonadota bacterium]|nr:MAG: polyphenol oxidase family protein [Gemmatimonadota bacterium]